MSTQPIFDMSKAQPIQPAGAPLFDMSKAQLINPPVTEASVTSRLGSNFLSGLGVTSNEQAKNFFKHPLDTVIQSFEAQGELAKKARDAYDRGDYMEALQHGLNYLVPFVGQQTDRAGTQLKEGDIAGGIGRTLGAAGPIVLGNPETRAVASDAAGAVKPFAARAAQTAGKTAVDVASDIPIVRQVLKVKRNWDATAPTPDEPTVAAPAEIATPTKTTPITKATVEKQLNDALGGQPLKPGVSLRNQPGAPAATALPNGFTPVDSTALKGYKYNPTVREFESITQGGQHYVHGDVSPEEASYFESAESKGKAWQQLRSQNPLIAKVVNGKRVPVKPVRAPSLEPEASKPVTQNAGDDLSSILQESLRRVQGGK
jgi:hypothetical protein